MKFMENLRFYIIYGEDRPFFPFPPQINISRFYSHDYSVFLIKFIPILKIVCII